MTYYIERYATPISINATSVTGHPHMYAVCNAIKESIVSRNPALGGEDCKLLDNINMMALSGEQLVQLAKHCNVYIAITDTAPDEAEMCP